MEQQNSSLFDIIIWSGAAISVLGLAGILWCIFKVARARRARLEDAQMQAVLKSVLPLNLGALFMSILGLMMVGVGIAFS